MHYGDWYITLLWLVLTFTVPYRVRFMQSQQDEVKVFSLTYELVFRVSGGVSVKSYAKFPCFSFSIFKSSQNYVNSLSICTTSVFRTAAVLVVAAAAAAVAMTTTAAATAAASTTTPIATTTDTTNVTTVTTIT